MRQRVMLRSAVAGLLLVLVSFGAARADQALDPAGSFIADLGGRAIDLLKNKKDTTFAQRESRFRELMVEGFDIPTISAFVLGRYRKLASPEQLQRYDKLFVDFIVRVYAVRFDSYSGETFEVLTTVKDASGDEFVRSRILRPEGAPVAVDFRVRKGNDARLHVVDVLVEGISMLNTHRQEFKSVIEKKGFDGFLDDLKARVDKPVDEGS